MKGGNSYANGSDLNKNNIIKPTFDTLTKEGRKSLEAYHTDLEELFYSCYEMMWHGTILKDAMPIIIRKADVTLEVRPNPPLSLEDVQSMINFVLQRQAKSSDELMRRLIEEWDEKKLVDSHVNPSSSSCAVNFSRTNSQTSGTPVGDTTMSNPSAQPMNHFHRRTIIDGSAPTFGMPQQTTISMFGQGYTETMPSFSMLNFSSAPYTPGGNGGTYVNASGNYQASYSTIAYTDLITLPGSSMGFLPNHTYHNATRLNAYNQPKANGFGNETQAQFPFRS
jgi:hypothetical protein